MGTLSDGAMVLAVLVVAIVLILYWTTGVRRPRWMDVRARLTARPDKNYAAAVGLCPYCGGDDAQAPCAYPGKGVPGCLRDKRLRATRRRQILRMFRWPG